MKFDPMTGEPIVQEEPVVEEKKPKFDPMTGEPIYENPAEAVLAQHKKTTGQKNLIVIAAVAVVALVVLIGVVTGLFQSKQMKILSAVAKTFTDESKLAKACGALDLIGTDAYTLYVKADVEGQEVEATLAAKKNEMQLSGMVDVSGMPEIQGIIGLDSKAVRATVDGLDTVLVYKFTEENDGELMDQTDEEVIELINETLVMLTSDKAQNNVGKKVSSAVLKVFNDWKIEKVDKKSFEVDGKKRNCTGYTFTIDENGMEDMSDAIVKALDGEVSDEVLDAFEDLMSDVVDGMEDTEVTVYIYKDMLAAVLLEIGSDEVEILFEGGEYRTQNVIVETEGYTVMELAGSTSGSVEEYELELAGREVLSMEYNEKSGELSIKEKYTGANISIDATLIGKSNELSFVLEDMDMDDYSISCDLEINLKKGASMQKIKGEEFDLGAADEDDLEDLVEDIEDAFY